MAQHKKGDSAIFWGMGDYVAAPDSVVDVRVDERHSLRLPTRSEGVVSVKPLFLDLERCIESFHMPAILYLNV